MEQKFSNAQVRILGLVILIFGLLIAWGFLIQPLIELHRDSSLVKRELAAIVVMPAALIYGILLLLGGAPAYYKYLDSESLKVDSRGWVVAPIALAIGAALYWWFSSYMHAKTFNRPIPPEQWQVERD